MKSRHAHLAGDQKYMKRALTLAKRGLGTVSPNPLVGCVIVRSGKIIAEGWHQKFGGDHAEIVALKKLGMKARGATLYVNLEPCSHFGKTPPCVDAVIAAQVKRVVTAMTDPNSQVVGRSVRKLRRCGIQVTVGVCEDLARDLNRFFIKHISTGFPYVIGKVAQSLDGKISYQKGKSGWITGPIARRYVQDLRMQVDAILVGRKTVEIDNPRLNVRDVKKHQPVRVVLDSKLKLIDSGERPDLRIFHTHGGPVVLACILPQTHPRVLRAQQRGLDVICLPKKPHRKSPDGVPLEELLKKLGQRGIAAVICEGGGEIFRSLSSKNMADEWQVIIAPRVIGARGASGLPRTFWQHQNVVSMQMLGNDFLIQSRSFI